MLQGNGLVEHSWKMGGRNAKNGYKSMRKLMKN